MRSSEKHYYRVLFFQELRALLGASSLWLLLVVLTLLVGYSFIQAVDLYNQASQTALKYPELGRGMNPIEGVFVPTFGAYYLVETLLLPFVVIRHVGRDRQTGVIKLLFQLPLSALDLSVIKLAALAMGALLIALPGALAIFIWMLNGGSLYPPELASLVLGHVLYATTIVCIAFFASVISSSMATAAMLTLALTLGSWVLDFSAGGNSALSIFSQFSFTALLRGFENGLLSSVAVAVFLAIALLFFLTAVALLHPGRSTLSKLKIIVMTFAVLGTVFAIVTAKPFYFDASENHRHSFNPADEKALRAMRARLKMTIHLARDDSRLYDLNKTVLDKLRRTVPKLQIIYAKTYAVGLFGAPEGARYGLIEFDYLGRHDETYSTSAHEILPILHALAGVRVKPEPVPAYLGHPHVAQLSAAQWWFYLFLPLAFLLLAFRFKTPQIKIFQLGGHNS